jgi:Xaa-Pro aminopeptidase
MSELEVQRLLDSFMFEEGARELAFPTIVATGAHGASPHAIPDNRPLEVGDAVVMDFGARYKGYCSDMTRTVFIGKPSHKMQAAWAALRDANERCESALQAGKTGSEIHQLAEDILALHGFEKTMGHGLGHSLGVDIHENPSLAPRNASALPNGAVLTVEPGIYLPGEFGMRLEDFGVVGATGFEVITQTSHDMVIIDPLR